MGARETPTRKEKNETTKSRSETTKSDEEKEAKDNVAYAQSFNEKATC